MLAIGSGMIVAVIGIGLGDRALRNEDGSSALALGPVSPMVVAGLLFALGVGLLIYQFLPHDDR
ncbi:MAG: hypothetical protein DYH12_23605 [Sorangiineae bacterium PRO1]|nr:hypothetical protein [Sorangiineae bacterium PRO1]